ncbi:MAG: hypothetical protein AAF722_05340 [Cyanobacteria bacterium P01_C01_bin.70]
MKRTLLSALTVLVASAAIAPVASAIEPASFNVQSTRLEELDSRNKNSVHKLRIEHLNNQTKAIEDIQAARLNGLDVRQKAVENIQAEHLNVLDASTKNNVQKLRLEHLNNQTKSVEDIQAARLEGLDIRQKAIDNVQEVILEGRDARNKSVR